MNNPTIEAKWTGKFPCLCSGHWILTIDGKDYSDYIPEDKQSDEMNTYGTYQSWHFENWSEVFENYTDGLDFEGWIKENQWIKNLPITEEFYFDVFEAFQLHDWRHGSCGGCI